MTNERHVIFNLSLLVQQNVPGSSCLLLDPDLELAICPKSPDVSSGKECFRVTLQTLQIVFQAPSLLFLLPQSLLSASPLLLLYWLNAHSVCCALQAPEE